MLLLRLIVRVTTRDLDHAVGMGHRLEKPYKMSVFRREELHGNAAPAAEGMRSDFTHPL
jgi:hypothetical protein